MAFEMITNRQVIFGEGKLPELVKQLQWYGKKKVLLVSYGQHHQGYKTVSGLLEEAGIAYVPYPVTGGEPDLHIIDHGRDVFLAEGCDCTVALGGGSVIDAAKTIGMLAVNGGCTEDYQLFGRAVTKEPPLFIAIPTTSGTGAEATKTAVVINNNNGLKKSLYHTSMIADIVIMDPTLTVELPKKITSATGMAALSHAIESYVSLNASPMTEMYGLKAMQLINKHLATACFEPENLEARAGMMLASYLAGCAITAGIGIDHIMAQPLGGEYHIPHGDACSIFLPYAMELNLPYAAAKYADIAKALDVYIIGATDEENGRNAIARVRELQQEIGAPVSLKGYIREEPDMDKLIDVVKRTTGHITCNPRPLTEDLMREIFALARQ